MQNKFGFILVNPQLGENIGACARAIKNFGFSNLNIVSPRDPWPNTKARMTSVGAFNIVQKAKIYNNVSDAVKKFDLVFASTARKRDINKKHISIINFIKVLSKYKKSNIGRTQAGKTYFARQPISKLIQMIECIPELNFEE